MRQFGVIFSHELRTYLKNKVFVGITLVLVLVMAVVMFFPRISGLFESQSTPEPGISPGGEAEDLPVMSLGGVGGHEAVELFSAGFPGYRVAPAEGDGASIAQLAPDGEGECACYLPSGAESV